MTTYIFVAVLAILAWLIVIGGIACFLLSDIHRELVTLRDEAIEARRMREKAAKRVNEPPLGLASGRRRA